MQVNCVIFNQQFNLYQDKTSQAAVGVLAKDPNYKDKKTCVGLLKFP
jgi:hypothetical protein